MGFKPYRAEFDLWMQDIGNHYEYLAIYVDDILGFFQNLFKIIGTIINEYN